MKARFVAIAIAATSFSVNAAETKEEYSKVVNAACYAPLSDAKNIKGHNIDERLPMASVSKLITSYWAVKAKTVNYRFQTVLYVTPVGNGVFDLHLEGSRDPYFGAQRLHFMISELNKRGIKNIRNMTFDENFKFYWSVDDRTQNGNSAGARYEPQDPTPDKVVQQLRAFGKLTTKYAETLAWAKKNKVDMVENPEFNVSNIEFLKSEDLDKKKVTQYYRVYSAPVVSLLKEMNRNSHNHAANQIFEHLEKSQLFSQFILKDLGLTKDAILMRNGSGDTVSPAWGPYNEASCSAVLKVMMAMHNTLTEQKSSFTRVATVIGTNEGNATNLYNNPQTQDFVAAKTGTVNPVVTLGGMANTKKGLVFFYFNMKAQGTSKTFNEGRAEIRKQLRKLMLDYNGGVPLKGQSFAFIGFDNKSFEEIKKAEILP